MSRRRARHDIIMEILKIAVKGAQKTNIMYKARLNHSQLERYLDALKTEGFLTNESGVWKTTKRGLDVIEACKICHRLLEEIS